jgi:DNA repair photolyase
MTKEKFGTKEWSDSSLNIMTGCPHQCRYCYSKADALRWKRIKSADEWERPLKS